MKNDEDKNQNIKIKNMAYIKNETTKIMQKKKIETILKIVKITRIRTKTKKNQKLIQPNNNI